MLKNIILSIFMLIFSFNIYADVPNEQITKNPKKEITTITSPKNRDYAHMSITVNKINIIDIIGVNNGNGEIEFRLSDENIFDKNNENIKVINHVEEKIKSRKKRSISPEIENNTEIPFTLENKEKETLIKLKEKEIKNQVYILKLDKNNNLKKVYAGKFNVSPRRLDTGFKGNDYIVINLPLSVNSDNFLTNEIITGGRNDPTYEIFNDYQLSSISGGYEHKPKIFHNINGDNTDSFEVLESAYFNLLCNIPRSSFSEIKLAPVLDSEKSYVTSVNDKTLIQCTQGKFKTGTVGDAIQEYTSAAITKVVKIHNQNNYKQKGGLFIRKINKAEEVIEATFNWLDSGTIYGSFPKKAILLLAPRHNKEISITAHGKQFDDSLGKNIISYETLGLARLLGYTGNQALIGQYGNSIKYKYSILSTESNTFMPEEAFIFTDTGLYFPENLKSGSYFLEVAWTANVLGKEYTIATRDKIKIDFTKNEENIGEIEFYVDERFTNTRTDKYLIDIKGINSDAYGHKHSFAYPELVNIKNQFTFEDDPINNKIVDVINVKDRTTKLNISNNEYKIFSNGGDSRDESAIRYNVSLDKLIDNVGISTWNSSNYPGSHLLNNRFTLQCEKDLKRKYLGNIKEVYINNTVNNATATLTFTSDWGIGSLGIWNPNTTGPQISYNDLILNINSGKLFNTRGIRDIMSSSMNNPRGKSIVTKLVVSEENSHQNISKEGNGHGGSGFTTGQNIEVQLTDNIIGIEGRDGRFYVKKLTNNSIPQKYRIEAFYQDISLGVLNLEVKNSDKINIGTMTFKIDKRLVENRPNEKREVSILRTDGALFNKGSNYNEKYPELITTIGRFSTPISNPIIEVLKVKNRPILSTYDISYDNTRYQTFHISHGNYYDESFIPKDIPLNELNRKAVVSIYNSTYNNGSPFLDNEFYLRVENEENEYFGNIKEEYINNKREIATASLDMKNGNLYTGGTWEPNISGDNISDIYNLKITSGKLFNTRGLNTNKSIVTRLIVRENGKELGNIVGNVNADGTTKGENLEIETVDNIIGIDGRTGELYVKKLTHNHKIRNYEIEIFYQDISLGRLNLNVENGYGFALVGSEIIDFGELFQGETVKKLSYLRVTNPLKYKIDVKIAENSKTGKMYLKSNPQYTVPLINSEVVHMASSGKEIESFQLSTTAAVPTNAKTGQYEGELEVIITILPKK